jgi:hypothetical protein
MAREHGMCFWDIPNTSLLGQEYREVQQSAGVGHAFFHYGDIPHLRPFLSTHEGALLVNVLDAQVSVSRSA